MKKINYRFLNTIYTFLISFVIIPIALFFSSCNGALGGSPETPRGVSASTTEEARIVLTWEESRRAGVYYIYRGEEEDFDTDQETFAAARSVASFIDLEIEEEKDYFYRVSAANIYGENESLASDDVRGSSHRYSWDPVQTLTESPSLEGFLAFNSEEQLYGAVLLDTGNVSIYRISGEEKTLLDDTLQAGVSPGKAAIALSGETLFAGTVSDTGDLSIWKWTGSAWQDFGSPEEGSYGSPAGIARLSLSASGQYLYAAFLFEYTDPEVRKPAVFRRELEEDSPWLALTDSESFSSFIDTSLASAKEGPGGCTGIRFLLSGNVPTLGLESKAEIRVYRYTSDQWNPLGTKLTESPVQGTLSMAYDTVGGQLFSAFWEEGDPADRLEIHQFENSAWKAISPSAGFIGESVNPPALALRRRNPVVVYETATGLKGQEYKEEEWKDIVTGKLPEEEISWPGGSPFLLSLDLKLYILFLEESADPQTLLRVYH